MMETTRQIGLMIMTLDEVEAGMRSTKGDGKERRTGK
jgi:hypothetical protein